MNSKDCKLNPSSALAKDFANAVQQRPEQKVLQKANVGKAVSLGKVLAAV